ncbi:hypothetical protein HY992_05260 [Candidatus Micrarchaeota archaeon]|nr:hypothetical protein [Candidatus Micrarchaeota archaeon]
MKNKRDVLELKAKKLARVLKQLNEGVVFVEGKRDKQALETTLANARITLIAGKKLDDVARQIKQEKVEKASVLTDFDRRGEELAQLMKEALESHSITADLQARRELKFILGLRFFEEFETKKLKFKEECSANGIKYES